MSKISKIALLVLTIGWFPFMFIAAWGCRYSEDINVIIAIIGFIVCSISSMVLLYTLINPGLWSKNEEYQKNLDDYRIAKAKYDKASFLFVSKLKVEEDNEDLT